MAKDYTITFYRGNTKEITFLFINMPEYDSIQEVYFTIKDQFEKNSQNGITIRDYFAVLELSEADTLLDIGSYKYDVQVNYTKDGKQHIYTLIPPSDLNVLKAIKVGGGM